MESTDYTLNINGNNHEITLETDVVNELIGTELRIITVFELSSIDSITDANKIFTDLNSDISFQGIITSIDRNNVDLYLEIPILRMITSPVFQFDGGSTSLSVTYECIMTPGEKKPFKIFSVNPSINSEVLEVQIFFADIPTEYPENTGGIILITGFVTITNNPQGVDIDSINFTSVFPFAVPGTETINFSTDPTGFYSFTYNINPNLTFPNNQNWTITLDETGEVIVNTALSVIENPTISFSANSNGGELEESIVTVSGNSEPGSIVTITSTNADTLFNGGVGVTVVPLLDGTWTVSDTLTPLVTPPLTFTISTSNNIGDGPINLNVTMENPSRTFAPVLSFTSPGIITGLPMNNQNIQTVRANKEINITAQSPDLLFYDENVTSSNDGSFTNSWTVPVTEEAKLITVTFTEIETNDIIIDTFTAADFDADPVLTLDVGQGIKIGGISGQNNLTGTYSMSPGLGHNTLIQLYDGSGTIVGNLTNNTGPGLTPIPFSISIDEEAFLGPNDWFITLDGNVLHNVPIQINPIIQPTIFEFQEGLTGNITNNGIIFPDIPSGIIFQGLGPVGATIDLLVFGTNYNTVASVVDRSWQIVVPVLSTQPLGSYQANITTVGLPGIQIDIDFDIVEPTLTLNSCPIDFPELISNKTDPSFIFNGEVLPGKDVTLTFNNLGGLAPIIVTGDDDGIWEHELILNWLETSNWDVTISAPGETSIFCNGLQEGFLEVTTDNNEFTQGSTGNSVLIRGPNNQDIDIEVTGLFNFNLTATTNALGFYLLSLPDVPLLTLTPQSGLINLTSDNQTGSGSYSITTRIDIDFEVTNPSAFAQGNEPILWINSSFNVGGSTPTNGIYSLSAQGSTNNFDLIQAGTPIDTFTALLTTSTDPGEVELTVSTVFQPSSTQIYKVAPVTTFEIPDAFITNNLYDLVIFSDPGTLAEFIVTSPTDGIVFTSTGEVDVLGEFRVVFNTTGLTDGVELEIKINTQWFNFEPQDRFLFGFGSGIPTVLNAQNGFDNSFIRYPDLEVTNFLFTIDNQPINEAGKPEDLISGAGLFFTLPVQNLFLENHIIESYENALTHWSLFDTLDADQNQLILTDFSLNYRITSFYNNGINSQPIYIPISDSVIFAKSVMINLNNSFDSQLVDSTAIEPVPFFISFTPLPINEDSLTSQVSFDIIEEQEINAVENSPFFTFTTVNPAQEDSLLVKVGFDRNLLEITTPEDTPFFTI